MADQENRQTLADRLKGLLDRLQAAELQLGEARELRKELLCLVGAHEADCDWV